MKKQLKFSRLTEAEEALIREVADKLPKASLFPEKVARAKALVKSINTSSKNKTTLS
jgi:hypothetical protein